MRRLAAAVTLLTGLALPGAGLAAEPPVELIINQPSAVLKDRCVTAHCKAALDLIDGAQESLDIAIYGLRNQTALFDAIKKAKERGVTVRLVVDKDIDNNNYYTSTPELEALLGDNARDDYMTDKRTAATRKPYDPTSARCDNPPGFEGPAQCLGFDLGDTCIVGVHASRGSLDFKGDIMHNKYIVADRKAVWMGSTNLSDSGTGGYNANLVTVIRHPVVARWFVDEFDQMFVDGRYHNEKRSDGERKQITLSDGTRLETYFSPQDEPMERAVRPLLQNAREQIDIAVFFLTHKGVAADLIAAHRRGVKVRVILDATAAKNGYSKHEILRSAGIPLKIETWGGKMHMKSAVIDHEHVIVGSMNWTSAGTRSNDENTIILHSKRLGRIYDEAFDKLWAAIDDRWLEGRPDPESMDSPQACRDGVDNDYDHLPDAEDPGCGPNPPPLPALPPHRVVPKEEGHGLVKGVVLEDGQKLFYTPSHRAYSKIVVDGSKGGRWFCSEGDAWDAKYRRARR